MKNNSEACAQKGEETPTAARWLSEGFEELLYEDSKKSESERQEIPFDIVIVGSGYGGALAAAELAGRKDKATDQASRICLLERGREYLAGMFPNSEADLPAALSVDVRKSPDPYGTPDGVVDLRIGKDVSVVLASGLGGGSLINAGVMEEAKPWVFEQPCWPKDLQKKKALNSWYEKAREMLSPRQDLQFNKVRESTKQKAFFRLEPRDQKTRERLKLEPAKQIDSYIAADKGVNSAGVKLDECTRCGDCMTGCNHRAKNSLDQNALVKARRGNVRIVCGAYVLKLERVHEPADKACWVLHVLHTDPLLRRRQQEPFRLRTRRVVLAAGSLGTTEILMRSRSDKLVFSSQLGERFSANGDLIAASYDEKLEVNAVAKETEEYNKRCIGPTTTAMLRAGEGEQQIVIQEFAIPGPIRRLFSEGFTTSHLFDRLANGDPDFLHVPGKPKTDPYAVDPDVIKRTQSLGVMGHDGAAGRFVLKHRRNQDEDNDISHLPLREHAVEIRWPDLKKVDGLFDSHMITLGELIKSSRCGGRLLSNPFWQLLPKKLTSLLNVKRGPALTTHPLGGCAMADTCHDGVVDQYGRVFNTRGEAGVHEGLVVLDGSFIPRSLGINPAFTISALVLRALAWLRDDWQTGPSADASRCIRPMPNFKQVKPAANIPAQIAIHERMVGDLHLKSDPSEQAEYTMELTLQFEPAEANHLATSMGRSLKVCREKSRVRIYRRDLLRELRARGESDFVCDKHAVFVAGVSGTLELLDRAWTTWPCRVLRGMYAWYRNRGKRDSWNALVSVLSGKKSAGGIVPPGFTSVASHAGEIRLFDYKLEIGNQIGGLPAQNGGAPKIPAGSKVRGEKRFTFEYAANPWKQLSEMRLQKFPHLDRSAETILELEPKHFAREQRHLFEIVKERDGVTGLMELFSFLLFTLRLVIATHLWSFRKPDTPSTETPDRLPGLVPGMRAPQISTVSVGTFDHKTKKKRRIEVRLARYRKDGAHAPVLLIHGFSASGTTFAHPALNPGLAKYLHDAGRDVWVVDLRTSAGLSTSKRPWSFEQVAFGDIMKVVGHIRRETGVDKFDVVAHCMGAAMMSMALLKPGSNNVAPYIRRVVLSQVGPVVSFTPANVFRAYCVRYIQQVFRDSNFKFRPKSGDTSDFLDRLLATVPYPREEFDYENPAQPCARTPFTTTRHRMDAWFGRVFNIANMDAAFLEHIDDFFGAINLRTSFQTIHFARYGMVTTRSGTNKFILPDRLERLRAIPIFSIHGAKNGLADPGTLDRMRLLMRGAGLPFKSWEVPDFGHQDCMMGRDAAKVVFPELLKFLDGIETPDPGPRPSPAFSVQMPYMGPLVGMTDAVGRVTFGIASDPRCQAPTCAITIAADQVDDAWKQNTLARIQAGQMVWHEHDLPPPPKHPGYWQREDDPPFWYSIVEDLRHVTTPPASVVLLVYHSSISHRDEWPWPSNSASGVNPNQATLVPINAVQQRPCSSIGDAIAALLRSTPIEELKQAHLVIPARQVETAAQLRFAVASCQYPAGPLDPHLATLSYARLGGLLDDEAHRPRCLLLVGDQIYSDATAGVFDPTQLDDRHELPYQDWLRTKQIRNVLRRLPLFAILDDHEIDNNWEPGLKPRKLREPNFRKGLRQYFLVQRSAGPPFVKPANRRSRAWYSTRVDAFDFFFSDTRSERRKRLDTDFDKRKIMSEAQALSLEGWLTKTNASADSPRFVISASMLLPRRKITAHGRAGAINSDAWDGYPASLYRLLACIANRRMQHLVFLSGDEHHSCIATVELVGLDENLKKIEDLSTLHSIHSSALNAPFPFANGEPADLAGEEAFWFANPEMQHAAKWPNIGCRVKTEFVSLAGDGFATLDCLRGSGDQEWRIECEFSRPDEKKARYRLTSSHCVKLP